MNGPVSLALIVAALIIVIGFLSNHLFDRTGLPDMLFLIVLGYVVGPVLRLFDASVAALTPYLAALALVFILFDGGMRMNIRQVLSHSPRAILLSLLSFLFSVLITASFMMYLVGVPLLYAILFGSILGGSSSVVVVSIAHKINVSEKCSTILTLESSITDIFCIVVSLAIVGVIITGQIDYSLILQNILGKFLIGAFVGFVLGLLWLILLKRVASLPYSYMLTLSIVLFGYTASEYIGGSGALSSLLFGLVLGNERAISKALKRERLGEVAESDLAVDAGLKRFESEIAFLIRTFFFVFLGLTAMISDIRFLIIGAILSLLLLLVRFGAVAIATIRSELRDERPIMSMVLTRGLAAAVLATLPLQYGLQYSNVYINLAVIIIVSTAIIATVGILVLLGKGKKGLDGQASK